MPRGHRRQSATSSHFCPNPECADRGWAGWGTLRANGPPHGGPWRQLVGVVCRHYVLEPIGTILHGKRTSVELIVRVIAGLVAGLGSRGTAQGFEGAPHTVLQWLVEAAAQRRAFSQFVERLHLRLRQHVAAIGRRGATLCKDEDGLRQPRALYHCDDNFCLPPASLRQPLPQPGPTNGTGSARLWRPCTPALAAGLTAHGWTLRAVRRYRVPPWPQPQAG
jgi:hypothetical protein